MRLRPLVLFAVLAGCGDDGTNETSTTMATDPAGTDPAPTTSGGSTGADTMDATTDGTTGGMPGSTGGGETAVPMVSFEAEIQPILTAICVTACHEPGGSGFGETTLDMTAGVAYAMLVDVPAAEPSGLDRIEPGAPEMSYLWHKISGTQADIGGVGAKMPIGKMLTPEEIGLIEDWILGGAMP